jgi:UDP-glucose 4-epimerase
MNILVTGSKGFIGSHLSAHLAAEGHTVFGICSKQPVAAHAGVHSIVANLEKKDETLQQVKKVIDKVDVIIHLASPMANERNLQDIDILSKSAHITETVAELAIGLHVSKCIHLSSMAVYPGMDGSADENTKVWPAVNTDALYGLSKFNAEVILDYKLARTAIMLSHLRAAMVYGPGMNSSRILPVFEKEREEKGTITVFGNGERMLNLVHVEKLVKIISAFVLNDWNGIYNVGDEYISMLELAQRVNKDGSAEIIMVEKGSRSRFELNFGKLKKILSV